MKVFHGHASYHFNEIDFIKSVAIVAVIILHTLPAKMLYTIFAPFHIWHAVPIFLVVAGMNSTLSSSRRGAFVLSSEYSADRFIKYFQRILLPFLIVWLFEVLVLVCTKKVTIGKVIYTFFAGGMGPGSYFTPIFIQHLLVFPLILWLKNKLCMYNRYVNVISFFLTALLLEWLCIVLSVPEWLYRLLYVRYLFAAFLGSYMVTPGLKGGTALFLTVLGIIYIACLSYGACSLAIIYPSWGFQHAPAYFYTIFLVICLWHIYPFLQWLDGIIMIIGKASYHIFLLQMVWFKMAAHAVQNFIPNMFVCMVINIGFCLLLGCLFCKIQEDGLRMVNVRFSNLKTSG